jgi:metal-sulfur cluster biosynthetic enzyme
VSESRGAVAPGLSEPAQGTIPQDAPAAGLTRDDVYAALRELPGPDGTDNFTVLLQDARVEDGSLAVLVLRTSDAAQLPEKVTNQVGAALVAAGFPDFRIESTASRPMPAISTTPTQDSVEEALRDVVDPELGINVVDLGLIYGLDIDDKDSVTIDMTLTSAACPLTEEIEDQAWEALKGVVTDFRINWVWMPPWGPEHITDEGREQLRALGFNI